MWSLISDMHVKSCFVALDRLLRVKHVKNSVTLETRGLFAINSEQIRVFLTNLPLDKYHTTATALMAKCLENIQFKNECQKKNLRFH